MLLLFSRIIGAFASSGKSRIIASAMATGITLAFIPGGTVLWFLLFLPMMLIRINQAALLGMMAAGKAAMPYIDPYSERFGYFILMRPEIHNGMGKMLGLPLFGWLRLDDSLVTGSLILGVAVWPFCFLLSLGIVAFYRKFLSSRVNAVFQIIGEKSPLLKKIGTAVSAGRGIGAVS